MNFLLGRFFGLFSVAMAMFVLGGLTCSKHSRVRMEGSHWDGVMVKSDTLPKTNIAPENRPSQ